MSDRKTVFVAFCFVGRDRREIHVPGYDWREHAIDTSAVLIDESAESSRQSSETGAK